LVYPASIKNCSKLAKSVTPFAVQSASILKLGGAIPPTTFLQGNLPLPQSRRQVLHLL
jgi:hypothetical protein